jgi:phosphoribosylformylglycinamidine cyclo-ligase
VAHITGGGFYENLPRCLPDGIQAAVDRASLPDPAIFRLIAERGGIPRDEMYATFNMGVGMVAVVAPEEADKAVRVLGGMGAEAFIMGEAARGDEGVVFL